MRRRFLLLVTGVVLVASCVPGSDDGSESVPYLDAPSSVTTVSTVVPSTTAVTIPPLTVAVRSGRVFDRTEDRLCEWFTDAEMGQIVSDAYGVDVGWLFEEGIFRSTLGSTWGCWWQARNWSLILTPFYGTSGFHEELGDPEDAPVHPHAALSDGIGVVDWPPGEWPPIVQIAGEERSVDVTLRVEGRGLLRYGHEIPTGFEGDVDTALSIADQLLRRMGWADGRGTVSLDLRSLTGLDEGVLAGVLSASPSGTTIDGRAGFVVPVDDDPFSTVQMLGNVAEEVGGEPEDWPWPSGVATPSPGAYTLYLFAAPEAMCCYSRWMPAATKGLRGCYAEVLLSGDDTTIAVDLEDLNPTATLDRCVLTDSSLP